MATARFSHRRPLPFIAARFALPLLFRRLTDHRIGLTLYKLDKVLGGDLDEVVDALVADERATQLGERDI